MGLTVVVEADGKSSRCSVLTGLHYKINSG